jgi:DNA-binding NarL/FixJ family response regulator
MTASIPNAIRIGLIEPDRRRRAWLVKLLNCSTGFGPIETYPNIKRAAKIIASDPPGLILIDIRLVQKTKMERLRRLKTASPRTLLVMMAPAEDESLVQALVFGASGYVLWSEAPWILSRVLASICQGESPLSGRFARKLLERMQAMQPETIPFDSLSARERQILNCLARGLQYKTVAEALQISLDTVRTHVRRLYVKLGVNNRAAAVLKMLPQAQVERITANVTDPATL